MLLFSCPELYAQTAVIAALKQYVCYTGFDNPVQVAAAGCADGDLALSVDNGTIRRDGGQWLYRPDTPGKANLTLRCRKGGTDVLLGRQQLRIKALPTPVATVAGLSEGTIPAGTLRAQSGVLASLLYSDLDFPVAVLSYSISLRKKNGQTQSAAVRGAYFSSEAGQIIRTAAPGDMLLITDIVSTAPDSRQRRLNDIKLQIR